MASTTLIAQNVSTGLAPQKATAPKLKTEQQNLNAKIQSGVILGVKQGSEIYATDPVEDQRILEKRLAAEGRQSAWGDIESPAHIMSRTQTALADAIECPLDAMISQPAIDFAMAYNMDEDAGYTVFQSFSSGGQIGGLRFWTISAYFDGAAWSGCTGIDPRPFDIGFYENNGGQPGTQIDMFANVAFNRVNTGVMFGGIYPVYEYTIELPNAVYLESGWFSIQSKIGTAVNCWNLALNQPGGLGSCILYETATGVYSSQDEPLGFCMIEGSSSFTKDFGISAILQPTTGVNLTAAEAIAITLKNYGTIAQSNIPWTVNWDGSTGAGSATGTYSGTIASGETATVNLTQTANLSTHGDYTFTACTALSGDEMPNNDCKDKIVTNKFPTYSYCDASTAYKGEYISNVLCGNIDKSSGWQGGVADYTTIYTVIPAGQSEDILVTNGDPIASDKVTCWVDWDMSYTFDEGDEKFILTSNDSETTFTGAIAVPAETPNGDYRMRIRMSYSTDPTPCGEMTYGEVEDYTIRVGEPAVKDVGVTALNMGGFYNPGVVSPKATVKNFGSATQTFNVTITIGNYNSTKSVVALISGATQEVTFDNWNASVGSYTAEACTQLEGDEYPYNNCKAMAITVTESNFAFAYNAFDPSGVLEEGPVNFDLVDPANMNLLAPTSSDNFIAGATWANDIWYGCMYGGGLYTIDSQTGAMVLVGTSPDLTGLAWDGSTMYGASATALYSIDPATGAGTLIGQLGGGGVMIGIACNAAGDLFGYDINDNMFYSIAKTTGAATAIGSLGFTFNYAQDMAFDKVNNVCYLAGYTINGTSGLYSVDVTTGAATFLAGFPGDAEITGFAIPYVGTAGLTVNPTALNETHDPAPQITIQVLNLTNNTGEPVSWTLAIDADGKVLNIIPEVSTETPVYTGQMQVEGTGAAAPWLTAYPVSGTINNGQTTPINLIFNSEGLSAGVHNGTVIISSNQPDIVVPVTLTIVNDVLEPPTNLIATIEDSNNVNLTWNAPAGGFDSEWITYSNENISNSIGTNAAISFDVAARWTPNMLGDFEGGMVTKIDFVPGEPGNVSTYKVKVWQGGNNNPTLKYSQPVTNIVEDQWNTIVLTEPVAIDITQELWVGFSVSTTGGFPAGCDDGPHTEGFGNMMFWEGAWTTLSQLGAGLDFDWAVKGYIESGMQVESYNVYRETQAPRDYGIIGNTTVNQYLDEDLSIGCYNYYVTAVYGSDMESDPSNIVTDICIITTSISDPSIASTLKVYPNPTNDHFIIKSEVELQSVTMVNYFGQVIFNHKATGNELFINANKFAKGVYTLQVETKDSRSVHKVIIQ